MKQLIARLRQLEAACPQGEWAPICGSYLPTGVSVVNNTTGHIIANMHGYNDEETRLVIETHNALPQLLDRLEALEQVAEAATEVFTSPSMLLAERTVGLNRPHIKLKNALEALKEKK